MSGGGLVSLGGSVGISLDTPVSVVSGGTGLGSYSIGDLLYASGSGTLSKLADVATGSALISGGIGVAPLWGKIGLEAHVSGILPIANGGTNSGTSLNNNRIMISNSGTIVESGGLLNGQLLIGSTGLSPVVANITAGSEITVTNGAGSITIASSPTFPAVCNIISTVVSNTETYISNLFPIPADGIVAGIGFKITVCGIFTAGLLVTSEFNIRFGTAGTIADTSLLSCITTAVLATSNPFVFTAYITFRSTTSAIVYSKISNKGSIGIVGQPIFPVAGSVVAGLTTSAAYLGVSFKTNSALNIATFDEVTVCRI